MEEEGVRPPLAPIDHRRKDLLHVLLVADEIVVHEIHPTPVAELEERFQLVANLLRRLCATACVRKAR